MSTLDHPLSSICPLYPYFAKWWIFGWTHTFGVESCEDRDRTMTHKLQHKTNENLLGLEAVHMESQVPLQLWSPNMEVKSQPSSLKRPLAYPLHSLQLDHAYFMQKKITGLLLRVGSSFLFDQALNTSPNLTSEKMLPRRHPCYNWDFGLGTPCEVVSPNFHALNGWDKNKLFSSDLGLRTWKPI